MSRVFKLIEHKATHTSREEMRDEMLHDLDQSPQQESDSPEDANSSKTLWDIMVLSSSFLLINFI